MPQRTPMSETVDQLEPTHSEPLQSTATGAAIVSSDPTDRPIGLFPEGVIAAVAGIALLIIALRHRTYLERKAREIQSAFEEFQRQGGVEDLTQVAKQASEFIKGTP